MAYFGLDLVAYIWVVYSGYSLTILIFSKKSPTSTTNLTEIQYVNRNRLEFNLKPISILSAPTMHIYKQKNYVGLNENNKTIFQKVKIGISFTAVPDMQAIEKR